MTCIVALKDGDDVYIGADRQITHGWLKKDACKLKTAEGLVFGSAGSARGMQIIEESWKKVRSSPCENDVYGWFQDCMIPLFKEMKDNDYNSFSKCNFILVLNKSIIFLDGADLFFDIPSIGYTSIGSGSEVALGSLYSTDGVLSAQKRVEKALEAAGNFSVGCSQDYEILKV